MNESLHKSVSRIRVQPWVSSSMYFAIFSLSWFLLRYLMSYAIVCSRILFVLWDSWAILYSFVLFHSRNVVGVVVYNFFFWFFSNLKFSFYLSRLFCPGIPPTDCWFFTIWSQFCNVYSFENHLSVINWLLGICNSFFKIVIAHSSHLPVSSPDSSFFLVPVWSLNRWAESRTPNSSLFSRF